MFDRAKSGLRATFFYEEAAKDWKRRTAHIVLQVAAVLTAMILTSQLLEWSAWMPGEINRYLLSIIVGTAYATLCHALLNATVRTPMAWMSVAAFCCELSLLALMFPYLMVLVAACTPKAIVALVKSDGFDLVGVGLFVAALLFGLRGWGRYVHGNLHARLVAENARLFERMAMEDVLTGLPNRRAFEQTMASWLARRVDRVATLMIDVNHFKKINDDFSHEVGDQVLQGIAVVLRTTVGEAGTVARLAGDEFVVGLLGLEHDAESQMIGRIEVAMAMHDWDRLVAGLRVSVSLGLARAQEGDGLADMLRRGDEQMYRYKRASRSVSAVTSAA